MNRRAELLVFLLGCLVCSLMLLSCARPARAIYSIGSTIHIRADGSIDPPSAPLISLDKVTYALINGINFTGGQDGIVIERSNIILDGNGYTIEGSTLLGYGLSLSSYINNVTVQNTIFDGFQYGVALSSSNNVVRLNDFVGNGNTGILLIGGESPDAYANNNVFDSNNITESGMAGIHLENCANNNITRNFIDTNSMSVGILISNSSNNIVSGNLLLDDSPGIGFIQASTKCEVYGNSFANSGVSITSDCTVAWDNGSRGNYWSDYSTFYPNAVEVGDSGVWDTPYAQIDLNNIDHYPLVNEVLVPEFPVLIALPLLILTTLLAVLISKRKLPV